MSSTEFDIEQPDALTAYLRATGRLSHDECIAVSVLAGGVSNRCVRVTRGNGEEWVLKQALTKLRVKVDWFSDPRRIEREADGIRWLERLAPPGAIVPLLFVDPQHHLLAMKAVPQPHRNWKSLLLREAPKPEHVEQFATLLGTLHRNAFLRRGEVEPVFRDRSFFETLRLEPYYAYTAEQVPLAREFLDALIERTRSRCLTLVHGDYSPKNVLVRPAGDGRGERLILLDHEVIHWGDPAFDLGFSLTHLLSKAHHLTTARTAFAQAAREYWETYRRALGDAPWLAGLESEASKHALGCLLARVAGRSPLEYLDAGERRRQAGAVLSLITDPPDTVDALVSRFLALLDIARARKTHPCQQSND